MGASLRRPHAQRGVERQRQLCDRLLPCSELRIHTAEESHWTEAQKKDTRKFSPGLVLEFHKATKDAYPPD